MSVSVLKLIEHFPSAIDHRARKACDLSDVNTKALVGWAFFELIKKAKV
jgi:hypothetical protein